MRKCLVVLFCLSMTLTAASASASISLPTAQHSLTVYIPPATESQSQSKPIAETQWQPIHARLNQKMATRSGPSTLYTEELGTVSQKTDITVFWQEIIGVPWAMVEFSSGGMRYRAYTGMKRIDADSGVPELDYKPQKAVIVPDIRPYYGPGTQYASVNHTLRGGTIVEICCIEQGYALIDYMHPLESEKRFRSWVPMSALKTIQ